MDNFSSRRIYAPVIRRDPKKSFMFVKVPNTYIVITVMFNEVRGVGYHVKCISGRPLDLAQIVRNDGITVPADFKCINGRYETDYVFFSENSPVMSHPEICVSDQNWFGKKFPICRL